MRHGSGGSTAARHPGEPGAAPDAWRHLIGCLEEEVLHHGADAFRQLRLRSPERFMRLAAELLPRDAEASSQGDGIAKILELIGDGRGSELADCIAQE